MLLQRWVTKVLGAIIAQGIELFTTGDTSANILIHLIIYTLIAETLVFMNISFFWAILALTKLCNDVVGWAYWGNTLLIFKSHVIRTVCFLGLIHAIMTVYASFLFYGANFDAISSSIIHFITLVTCCALSC
jgi:hypothetical protein